MKITSSLKQALTLNFILAAVLPIAIFAMVTINYVSNYLVDEVIQDNVFLAGELQAQTEDFLTHSVSTLTEINNVLYLGILTTDEAIDEYLEREVRSVDFFESVYILDQNGKVANLGVSTRLEQQKQDYFSIDLSSHELYQQTLKPGQVFWSDTFISVVTGEPSITIGIPVRNEILVGNLSLNRLNRIVARFGYADNITFAIIDRKGSLIAHSDTDMALQRVNMMYHPEVRRALESKENVLSHTHEDKSMLESVINVAQTGWVVWVGRERAVVLAPVVQVRNFMLLVLGGSFIAGIWLSIVNSRKIMRPISVLVDGVERMADGNYDISPPKKSYLEVNNLVTGFKRMALAVVDRENSIRERETRFRNLVNSIEGIVWEYDVVEKRFTFVSRHCEQMLGCTCQQWLSDSDFWENHIHPDDRQWVVDYFQGLVMARLSPQFEFRMINTEGEVIWMRNMVNVILEEGHPVRLYGVIIDINDRKQSEIALRDSEVRFRSLVEQAADIILIHDQDGAFIEVNEQACRTYGFTRSELLTMSLRDVEVDHDPLRIASFWNTVQHGNSVTIESEHKRKDGATFPAEVRIGSFVYQDTPIYLALVRDVSERKQAYTALRESEEQVRLLLDSTAEGIYGTDPSGNCTLCNPAALKILGFETESQFVGQNVHELIHHSKIDGSPLEGEDCAINRAIGAKESVFSDEEIFWRQDGSWFYVEYRAHPILKDDELLGAVVTFHDVTEQKLLQQQSIRTAQLASLGELAAGVAHEINNPINGVINYAQILMNRLEKSDLDTDLADRIIKEGERIATIVKDLLFFAREGGPEVRLSSAEEILGEALSLTEAQIRKEGIHLVIEAEDNLPLINSRAQQIQQLFLNILSNARHALNERFPGRDDQKKIEISLVNFQMKKKKFVRITFRDHGTGISKKMLEKVMNPFVTTKPAGVGTGLGLSISHEIVNNHNGDLVIKSEKGEWTEVIVTLPGAEKDV